MNKLLQSFVILFFILTLGGCAGNSIFQPISLSTTSPTVSSPIFFAIDETNARGYLINSDNAFNYSDGSLLILNLSTPEAPTVVAATSLKHFCGQAVLDSTAKKLYVTNRLSDNANDKNDHLLRVDVDETSSTFLQIEEFDGDDNPFGIVSNGSHLFVANQESLNSYNVLDLTHRTQVKLQLETDQNNVLNTKNTRELTLSPSGNLLFVTNRGDRMFLVNVNEIPEPDTALDLTVAGADPVDYVLKNTSSTRGITTDGQWIYVVEGNPPALKILSEQNAPPVSGNPQEILISTLAIAEIPLGEDPSEVVVDAAHHRAYVTISKGNEVAVIDTEHLVEIARLSTKDSLPAGIDSGEAPFAISLFQSGGTPYIYVLNQTTHNISILNGSTLQWVGNFP